MALGWLKNTNLNFQSFSAMDLKSLTVYLDDWSDFVPSSVFLIEIILRSLFVATPKIK